MTRPHVSVVVCTFNRAAVLRRSLDALREQNVPMDDYEILVVDNNSTDSTPRILADARGFARHVREPRQGLSHARNLGIAESRAPVIAFTDDDVCVSRDWIRRICHVAANRPDVSWFGGRVMPRWDTPPPAWLGPRFWPPLALLDYGHAPVALGAGDPRVVIGANLVVRRAAFDAVGLFRADMQRVGDGIGSTEDHELQLRMARHGLHGLYVPDLLVQSPVDPARTARRYQRRWHAGHGRFFALMRDPSFERSARGRVLDVPLHVYRSLAAAAGAWLRATATFHVDDAFAHELHARFLAAYAGERIRRRLTAAPADLAGHVRA